MPDSQASPNSFSPNFFNSNSPRGVIFSTPGTGFQVSANAGVDSIEFGNIDANYSAMFDTFSAQRLFTPIGSNIFDVLFFIPGSSQIALTNGFGAVFTDVDVANSTSIEFFDINDSSLGQFSVLNASGNETLSFLGVSFADSVVRRARIISGNQLLMAGNISDDLVVMDDFIYGEPTAVPEPATAGVFILGASLLFRRRRI